MHWQTGACSSPSPSFAIVISSGTLQSFQIEAVTRGRHGGYSESLRLVLLRKDAEHFPVVLPLLDPLDRDRMVSTGVGLRPLAAVLGKVALVCGVNIVFHPPRGH